MQRNLLKLKKNILQNCIFLTFSQCTLRKDLNAFPAFPWFCKNRHCRCCCLNIFCLPYPHLNPIFRWRKARIFFSRYLSRFYSYQWVVLVWHCNDLITKEFGVTERKCCYGSHRQCKLCITMCILWLQNRATWLMKQCLEWVSWEKVILNRNLLSGRHTKYSATMLLNEYIF